MATYQCQIDNVYVIPKYPDHVYIAWSVDNPSLPMDYFFDIYISDNPNNDFIKLNNLPIINETHYVTDLEILNKQEFYYFKVILTGKFSKSTEQISTFTYSLPTVSWLPIKEIIRKKDLVRRLFTGIPCIIRKRKTLVTLCTRCIDTKTGLCTDSKCPICFGTKYIKGYSSPIEQNVEIVENGIDIKPTEIGTIDNLVAVGSLSYPLVFTGDIIIEKNRNRRWYVNGVQREIIRTYCIDQKIELRMISPKDIEYSL